MSLIDLRVIDSTVVFTPADTGKQITFHCNAPESAEILMRHLDDNVMGVQVEDLPTGKS